MRATLAALACAALLSRASGSMFAKAASANAMLQGGLPSGTGPFAPPGPPGALSQFAPPGPLGSAGAGSIQSPFGVQNQLGGLGSAAYGEQGSALGSADNPNLNVIDLSARRAQNDAIVLGPTEMVNAATFKLEMPSKKGDLVVWRTKHGQLYLCVYEGEDFMEIPNHPDSFAAQVVLTNCKKYSNNPNSLTVVKFGGRRFPGQRLRTN